MTINSNLDFIDVKILNTVQQDARITKTKLSEEAGLSVTPCHIRLKKLEGQGIISGYYADIDYTAFGDYSYYWVQARILDYTKAKALMFEDVVMEEAAVLECISTLGKVDYLLKIAAKTVQSYQDILDRMGQHEGFDLDYTTYPMVRQLKKPQQSSLIRDHEKVYREQQT